MIIDYDRRPNATEDDRLQSLIDSIMRALNEKADKAGSAKGTSSIRALGIDDIYPVGSIYMSVNAANPSTLFPGTTWEKIKDRFLLAAGDTYTNASTGGSATVTLTADQSGIPEHNHPAYAENYGFVTARNSVSAGDMGTQTGTGRHYPYQADSSDGYWARPTLTGKNTGTAASQAHENMPPYLAVNVWKRTA